MYIGILLMMFNPYAPCYRGSNLLLAGEGAQTACVLESGDGMFYSLVFIFLEQFSFTFIVRDCHPYLLTRKTCTVMSWLRCCVSFLLLHSATDCLQELVF